MELCPFLGCVAKVGPAVRAHAGQRSSPISGWLTGLSPARTTTSWDERGNAGGTPEGTIREMQTESRDCHYHNHLVRKHLPLFSSSVKPQERELPYDALGR